MEKTSISFRGILKETWHLVWTEKKAWIYFQIFFLLFVFFGLISWLAFRFFLNVEAESDQDTFSLILEPFAMVASIGLIAISFDILAKKDVSIKTYFQSITRSRIRKLLVVSLIYGWGVVIGILLFIVPGVILSVRWYFVFQVIIDKGYSPRKALTYSWKITKGHFWRVVWFNIYFGFFQFLGVLCLLIGTIWTAPMYVLAQVKYYQLLSEQYEKNQEKETQNSEH